MHALGDLAAHNTWATLKLIRFCADLEAEMLDASMPGTYGTIIETLRHIVDAELSYTFRLTGAWSERPWVSGETADLETLAERVRVLETAMQEFLTSDVDTEKLGEAKGDDGSVFAVPAGIFITQIFHHANEHRAQINSILGARGFEVPDLQAWAFGMETGRTWKTRTE